MGVKKGKKREIGRRREAALALVSLYIKATNQQLQDQLINLSFDDNICECACSHTLNILQWNYLVRICVNYTDII